MTAIPTDGESRPFESRPFDVLGVLRRKRAGVAAVTLAALVAAALYSVLAPPTYEAQALIHLSEQSSPVYAVPGTAVHVIMSPGFLEPLASRVGLPARGRALLRAVSAQPIRDTRLIRVRVRDGDPARAERMTAAIVETFVGQASVQISARRRAIERRLDAVNAQIAEVNRLIGEAARTLAGAPSSPRGEAERGFTRSFALNALGVSGALYSGLVAAQKDLTIELMTAEPPEVVQRPRAGRDPVAPQALPTFVLAVLVGLTAGVALAVVWELLATPPRLRPIDDRGVTLPERRTAVGP